MLSGDNSILKNVSKAKFQTERAQVEEALKLAWTELVGLDYINNSNSANIAQAVTKANNLLAGTGLSIESKNNPNIGSSITGVTLSNSDVIIGTDSNSKTAEIIVTIKTGELVTSTSNYYAKINGQYYKVNDDLSIAKTITYFGGNASGGDTDNPTIKVNLTGEEVAIATVGTVSNGKATITITGKETATVTTPTSINVIVNGIAYNNVGTITAKELDSVTEVYYGLTELNSTTGLDLDGAVILRANSTIANNKKFIWSSSNTNVARVTSDGIVMCGTDTGTATITCKGKGTSKVEFTVTSTSKIANTNGQTMPASGVLSGTKSTTNTEKCKNPTIPAGFYAIDTGIGTENINAIWSTNLASNTAEQPNVDKGLVIMDKNGNQFVWVPVPNVVYDSTNATQTANLLTTEVIASSTMYTPMATTYQYDNGDGNGTKTYYRGMLYSFSETTENNTIVTKVRYNSTWTPGTTNYREPSLITDSGDKYAPMTSVIGTKYDAQYYSNAGNYISVTDFGQKMQEDYDNMVASVFKYGGFWIARYESSLIGNTTRVIAGAVSVKASDIRWYGLYKRQKGFAKDNDLDNYVTSSMVWGSQYDAMLNWMTRQNIRVAEPAVGISNGTATKNKNTDRITGTEITDKLNNVFDLRGNSEEWTLEANVKRSRAFRGGWYNTSNTDSASRRETYYRRQCTTSGSVIRLCWLSSYSFCEFGLLTLKMFKYRFWCIVDFTYMLCYYTNDVLFELIELNSNEFEFFKI